MIPVLNSLIEDSSAVSLLMYPTKALCNDQTLALQSWVSSLKVAASLKCCGDTINGCRPSLLCGAVGACVDLHWRYAAPRA